VKGLLSFFFFLAFFFCTHSLSAQQLQVDSVSINEDGNAVIERTPEEEKLIDSLRRRRIKRTIIHSAIIPGWGQINNKQAWKLPFVAAAVGLPAVIFFYNINEYKGLRQAYIYKSDTIKANDELIPEKYSVLSANSLRSYRDEFRRNVDYSVLVFILAWGLQVADAAVYAHLRDFDVSDNLSMKIKPNFNFQGQSGVALVFNFKNPKPKTFSFIK
jgi:hypothetical protein